jgi:hypothetical protein
VESVWFENRQVAKACKIDIAVTQDTEAAQILVVGDYEKSLKGSVASLHCRLHGKILAGGNAKIENGKLTGQYTSFSKPTQKFLVYASSAVTKKHHSTIKELQRAPCVKLMTCADIMLKASKDTTASSQIRWLGVKAELMSFAQKLQAANNSNDAKACTATHFVESLGV